MDEYRRRLKDSRGYDAKRADARRFVFTTMTAKLGMAWWNQNKEILLREMEVAEGELLAR